MIHSDTSKYRNISTFDGNEVIKIIHQCEPFKNSNVIFIDWLKGGYTSKTGLVIIDDIKYIFKKVGNLFHDNLDSLNEKALAAKFLEKKGLFDEPIHLLSNFYLFKYETGTLKKAFDWKEIDYKNVLKLSKKISNAVDPKLFSRNKMSHYYEWVINNTKSYGIFTKTQVMKAREYFSNGKNEVFVHGDLHSENIVFHNNELKAIDWDTFCVAKPHTDLFFIIIQTPWLYDKFTTIFSWFDWDNDKFKKEFTHHIIYYHLRWKIIFSDHFEEFSKKYNIDTIWRHLWN